MPRFGRQIPNHCATREALGLASEGGGLKSVGSEAGVVRALLGYWREGAGQEMVTTWLKPGLDLDEWGECRTLTHCKLW